MFSSFNLRKNRVAFLIVAVAGLWLANINNHRTNNHFDVKNVTVAEANSLINAGAIVIDVRDQDKFNFRHIPGAILIPLDVLRAGIPLSIAAFKNKAVVVYCNEGLSHGPEGAYLLKKAGFTGAVSLGPGIEGWDKSGMPIQKGIAKAS